MSAQAVSRGQKARSELGDFVLTLLAAAGLICIVMVILGAFFNVSIMMFRTGSMSPTITAGSIALVREIPASEMRVGDVVTVERGRDVLPVTHRVTQIIDTAPDGIVTFEMRGDANESADPAPYSVSAVNRVFFSIPGAAPVIQWFSNAYVLGGLTIGASALVVWAFWPKNDEEITRDKHNSLVLPAVILAAATTLIPPAANNPDILQLRSYADTEAMQNMSPGDSASWIVDAWADEAPEGSITLNLSAEQGELSTPEAFAFSIVQCSFIDRTSMQLGCPPESKKTRLHVGEAQLTKATGLEIGSFPSSQRHRIVISATVADQAPGSSAGLVLTATGLGDSSSISPLEPPSPSHLPSTGTSKVLLLGVAALLISLAGRTLICASRSKDV